MNKYIKKWLNTRGISDIIIEKSEIEYKNGRIAIPVIDVDGYCQFRKTRQDPRSENGAKYLYESGANATLYNAFMNRATSEITICEGELDALALQSQGFPAVSSTGGANTFKDDWLSFFEGKEDIFILYDYDEAGIKGSIMVQEKLPKARIVWLPKKNDATEYLQEYGADKLRGAYEQANTYPVNLNSSKEYSQAAELMIQERRQLQEEAMPAIARVEHTKILQQYYLQEAKRLKKKNKLKVIPNKGRGSLDVEAAKKVPIDSFLEFNAAGKASCLWHSDKTPSLHYYEKDNRVHCFVCGKQWDVIDIIQKKLDKDFKEAVKLITSTK
jgi:DNA primase